VQLILIISSYIYIYIHVYIYMYMYTYVSQVAAVYHVQITVRGLTTPVAVDMTY